MNIEKLVEIFYKKDEFLREFMPYHSMVSNDITLDPAYATIAGYREEDLLYAIGIKVPCQTS